MEHNIKTERIIKNLQNSEERDNEDQPVLEFFDTLSKTENYDFLEVGSGLCHFVDKIKNLYPNFHISCLEINQELANRAKSKGYKVINKNLLNNSLLSEGFDIIHCSHVIEHFTYPEISLVIDELFRITKINGTCIIRSPLMWKNFYFDLDHVRPYPPEAILNYFNNEQQQNKGQFRVQVINIWYRTAPKQYKIIDRSSLWYGLKFLRKFINKRIMDINKKFESFWKKYRFPASKPNGYVMILKKIQ